MATTRGAPPAAGSYTSATAMWVGFVTTTEAPGTADIMRLRVMAICSDLMRCFTSGSPSLLRISSRTSCLVIFRSRRVFRRWNA